LSAGRRPPWRACFGPLSPRRPRYTPAYVGSHRAGAHYRAGSLTPQGQDQESAKLPVPRPIGLRPAPGLSQGSELHGLYAVNQGKETLEKTIDLLGTNLAAQARVADEIGE